VARTCAEVPPDHPTSDIRHPTSDIRHPTFEDDNQFDRENLTRILDNDKASARHG
jgi:hypothetical protein